MHKEYALDLKVARRNAGFTQADLAHLLGLDECVISRTETGKRTPTITEMCKLSLIYGKTFENLFHGIMKDARSDLFAKIVSIPDAPLNARGSFNREKTLDALMERLEALDRRDYDER